MVSPLAGLAKTMGKAMGPIFFDAVLTRDVIATSPDNEFDPPPPTQIEYTCKAIVEEYSTGVRGQGLVNSSDMQVLVLADSIDVEPHNLDRIAIASQGFSGTVVPAGSSGMKAVSTDPAKAVWILRCAS